MDAALIFDIDSSRARTAATDLAKLNAVSNALTKEWASVDRAIRRADGTFRTSNEVVAQYGDEVERLAAKYNPALNAVYRFQQAEQELQRAVALGVLSKDQAADALDRVKMQLAATANAAARTSGAMNALGNEMQQGGHHTANVFAQLNDIGVMLAAGQNPFQLALQQGTQLNQVWAQMGAQGRTLGGVFGVLRGAVASMLSPMSLLTIGTIAGAGALINWASSGEEAKSSAEQFEDSLSALKSAYSDLETIQERHGYNLEQQIERYGRYWMTIRGVTEELHRNATEQARQRANEATSLLGIDPNALAAYENQVNDFMQRRNDLSEESRRISVEALGLNQEALQQYGLQYEQLRRLAEIQEQLKSNDLGLNERNRLSAEFNALIRTGVAAGADLKDEMLQAGSAVLSVAEEMSRAQASTEAADKAMKRFSSSASSASLQHLVNQASGLVSQLRAANGLVNSIGGGFESAWDGVAATINNAYNLAVKRGEQIERLGLGDRPGSRPFAVSENAIYGPEPDKGGGGGKSEAEKLAEEMKRRWETLNEGFQSEYMLAMQAYAKDQETLKWALDQKLISQQEYQDNLGMLYANAWQGQWEKDQLQYDMDQQALQAALDNKLIAEEDYLRKRSELNWQVVGRLGEDMSNAWAFELGNFSKHLGEMNQIAGGYDGILRAQKVFGAASALISTYTGAAEALKLPFPQNIAAAAKVLATGMGFVNAIKGSGSGGGRSGGAAASASTQVASQDPTKYVTVRFDGPDWMRDGVESLLDEIYDQSKNGRVIIARDT